MTILNSDSLYNNVFHDGLSTKNVSLYLDYDSSLFDEEGVETESDDDVIVGAEAYMFEPEFAEGEVEDLVDEDGDDNDRLLNTEW